MRSYLSKRRVRIGVSLFVICVTLCDLPRPPAPSTLLVT